MKDKRDLRDKPANFVRILVKKLLDQPIVAMDYAKKMETTFLYLFHVRYNFVYIFSNNIDI